MREDGEYRIETGTLFQEMKGMFSLDYFELSFFLFKKHLEYWILPEWSWHATKKPSGYISYAKFVAFNSC